LLPTFCLLTFAFFLCSGTNSFMLFDPNIHRVLSTNIILTMPPRRVNQRLHPDEGLPQTSDQNQLPFQQPSTQTLPTIGEAAENPTFNNILGIQL
jgi:hypothetical protein